MNGEDARQPEWGFEMRMQSDADRPATEPRTRYEDVAPEGRRISDVGGESSLVQTLSTAMLAKLAKNRGKRHWQDAAPTYLIDRLRQEVEELEQAIGGYLEEGSADEDDVWAEAADVANFAAMLADNATGRAEAAQGAAPRAEGLHHPECEKPCEAEPGCPCLCHYDDVPAGYRKPDCGAAPRAEGLDVAAEVAYEMKVFLHGAKSAPPVAPGWLAQIEKWRARLSRPSDERGGEG